MPELNRPGELDDDLIREAIYQELESIEPPPVEKSWSRIEYLLSGDLSQEKLSGPKWTRYAAAAAALLVLVISSIGVYQMTDLASPAAEEAPVRVADEPEAFYAEVETEDIDTITLEETVYELSTIIKESDPRFPDWQESLPRNLVFDKAVLLDAAVGPAYHGALYHREEEIILWVKSKEKEEAPVHFVEQLGEHIEVLPQQVEKVNGFIYFEAAGQSGLAWQTDNRNQALLVISGEIGLEQLKSIIEELL